MPILGASNPLLFAPSPSFLFHPSLFLSSRLVNSRRDITKEIRQNDYLFLLPFSTLFLLSFAVPFCAPFALKRGIKWPCISQEVGVSPWCSFQKVREGQGEKRVGDRGETRKKGTTKRLDRCRFSSWTLDVAFFRSPTGSFYICICSFRFDSSYSLVLPFVVSLISPSRGGN